MHIKKMIIRDVSDFKQRQFIQSYGIGQYELCPCKSGKKYKWCCGKKVCNLNSKSELLRFQQQMFKTIWGNRDIANPRCIYSQCNELAIGSHSIQRGGPLKIIQPNDQKPVYRYISDFVNGEQQPKLRYEFKNEASIFYGFCSKHDRVLFKDVECDNYIDYSKSNIYALVYRSVAFAFNKIYRRMNFKTDVHFKAVPQLFSNKLYLKNDTFIQFETIHNFRTVKTRYNNMLEFKEQLEKHYNDIKEEWDILSDLLIISKVIAVEVNKAAIVFHNTHPIVSDAKVFYGNDINFDFLEREKNNYLTALVIPISSKKINILIATRKEADYEIKEFVQQFGDLPMKDVKNIINNLIINNHEEFYFTKEYHDKILSKKDIDTFKEYINEKTNGYVEALDLSNIKKQALIDFIK